MKTGRNRGRRLVFTAVVLAVGTVAIVALFNRSRDRTSVGASIRPAVLAERLDALGLWRDLSPALRESAKQAVAGGGHPWTTEMARTVSFIADGEELAEGGVQTFLAELRPVLAERGVTLRVEVLVDPSSGGGYVVGINGERVEIYRDPTAFGATDETNPWFVATVRPLATVNRLLAAAGATERFFTLYTGANDGIALLIDPRIVDVLVAAGLEDPNELPRLAA